MTEGSKCAFCEVRLYHVGPDYVAPQTDFFEPDDSVNTP